MTDKPKEKKEKEKKEDKKRRPGLGSGLLERAARRLEGRDDELERKIKEAEKGTKD